MGEPLRWLAVDSTGAIAAELPSLVPDGPLRRTMGRYESQTFTLTVTPKTDPSWFACTAEGAGALIAYTGDAGSELVAWGGIVSRRVRGLGNTVNLTATTPEWYLDARYTGTYSVANRDQNLIMSDFVAKAAAGDSRVVGSTGWPFTTTVLGATGTLRTRTYADQDDKTLYAVMDELSHVIGGPQWLTGWAWTHGPERIRPVVTVGTRIGQVAPTGLGPAVTLTSRMMLDGSLDIDYGQGKGANLVTAVSSGQGTVRPQQSAGTLQPQRPLIEYRYTPSTSITATDTLLNHAQSQLAVMLNGAQTISVTVNRSAAPDLGDSWDLGDDVAIELSGPLFPQPVSTVGQMIGYDLTEDTITPYLAVEGGF